MKTTWFGFLSALAVAISSGLGAERTVRESARELPVAYEVDVVVVGGTSAGVAAAVEAAEQGARVFLAAPRPYLGEDLCGTYQLWLEPGEEPTDPLAKRLFAEPPPLQTLGKGIAFEYEASRKSDPLHKDTRPPSKLCDGKYSSASKESVQYADDVTITLDLGKSVEIGKLHVMAYQRPNSFEIASVAAQVSTDGKAWRAVGKTKNPRLGQTGAENPAFPITLPLKTKARYLRLNVDKPEHVERMLLGEIIVEPTSTEDKADGSKPARVPPMPMQVKIELDRALINAGVEFLYGCRVTNVLRDVNGYLAGVVMTNRSGRQAVKAKVVIDATARGHTARIAGAEFAPFTAGKQAFKRIVVGGELLQAEDMQGREMPSRVQIDRTGLRDRATRPAYEYTLELPVEDSSYASRAVADHLARDKTWHPDQVGASEVMFQVPPDPVKGRARHDGDWPGVDQIDLDVFRPADLARMYLLNACADVSRQAAEEMLRPLTMIDLGRRIGRAAVVEANIDPLPRIVCFGDSITAAGYPAELGDVLPGRRVINAGVGGHTTAQGLERIATDVLAHKPKAVVVLYGTNDSVLTKAGAFRVPVDAYEKNLREIVSRCRKQGARVVLCTPPPIIAESYFERHPKEQVEAKGGLEAILARYADAVRRVGESTGAPVVDLARQFPKDSLHLKACGVHPTPLGQKRIASLVGKVLQPIVPKAPRPEADMQGVQVASEKGEPTDSGDTHEFLRGVRATQTDLPTVPAGEQLLPVLGEYDVVVVGGGTGGAPAGIGAARNGAKTLVIEYLHGLGGVGTLGMIGSYYWGFREGFTAEVDRAVADLGGLEEPVTRRWNIEHKMEYFRRELRKAGADVWYGTLGSGALVEDGRVKGVIVATPEGRGVVLAKVVIDSTGNSDIAAAAGAQCIFTDGSHVAVQGTGLPPRKPGASYTNTDYTLTVDADMVDMWRSFVAAKEKFEDAYDLGQVIDTRERRRIVGDFMISPLDIYNGRTYPDTIGLSHSNFDTHGFTVHPLFSIKVPDKKGQYAYTPIRALLPKGLKGILVTGLGISAHRDAMPILRMQPDIQNQGYAAGTAAAMAVESGKPLRRIDIRKLQRHLVDKGNLPESVLTDKDNFPKPKAEIAKAVASVTDGYEGIGLILAQPEDAKPLLRRAYKAAGDDEARLIYAHILGMMGDGAGAETLIGELRGSAWDAGWSFKGGGQFGASLSPVDSLIIALGRTRDPRAVEPILEMVRQLEASKEFSHHRAVAVALETLGDPAAAQPLADLLAKPAMSGYAVGHIGAAKDVAKLSNPNQSRDQSLRELILARALYRCGDHEGIGEAILREFAQDYRGHHARHAQAVLREGKR